MEVLETVDRARLTELRERDEFFWLDLSDPSAEEVLPLGDVLGLHPVALEDTIEFNQRPKLDCLGDHMPFAFYTVRRCRDQGGPPFEAVDIHIYISGSFVVTVRDEPCTELD